MGRGSGPIRKPFQLYDSVLCVFLTFYKQKQPNRKVGHSELKNIINSYFKISNFTICLFLLGKRKENAHNRIVKLKCVFGMPCCGNSLFSGIDSCLATWFVHPAPSPRGPLRRGRRIPKKRWFFSFSLIFLFLFLLLFLRL